MKKPTPTFDMGSMLIKRKQGEPEAAAEAAASPAFVPFANRISADNKRNLDRMAYWMPGTGKVQKILNAALAAYFAQQDPHDLRPIPTEPQ